MLSGYATIDKALEATRLGAEDFLKEPIHLRKLLAAVGRAVKNGHAAALPHSQPAAACIPEPSQETLQWPQAALSLPYREARLEFERAYFLNVLAREGGNMSQVAQRTGIERTYLYRKFHVLGLRSMRRA